MQRYEYKVVAAPRKGEKARGLKTTEDRFAHALTGVMNTMARDGWEYWRTDTLPVEERTGLTGKTTTFQNMMIFRKPLAAGEVAEAAVTRVAPPAAPSAFNTAPSGAPPKLSAAGEGGSAPSLGSAFGTTAAEAEATTPAPSVSAPSVDKA